MQVTPKMLLIPTVRVLLSQTNRLLATRTTENHVGYFITTPIFYVNADPHIGHLYSACLADASHRFHRLQFKEDVTTTFGTGTDEHGIKVQRAASQAGVTPEKYAKEVSGRFQSLFQMAGVEWTDFVRTTEERHKRAVKCFWDKLTANGLIYKREYHGWYCISEETFVPEVQLAEGPNGKVVAQSGLPVEWSSEENYIFRLASFQKELQKALCNTHSFLQETSVQPPVFREILQHWLNREELQDLSVSRPASRASWGIPVPSDSTHTIYVWLDALVNYLTLTGYPEKENFSWPPSRQIIGKDILRFHGIYWPAFLLGAGLEPPSQLWCHSHWTIGGEKMSKSKGNVIDPFMAAQRLSPEGLRYFLLREGVPHSDGSYSEERAIRILNSELADTLGNLLSRCLAPAINPNQVASVATSETLHRLQHGPARELVEKLKALPDEVHHEFSSLNFYHGVDLIMAALRSANGFFQEAQPWVLAKRKQEESYDSLNGILGMTVEALRVSGILLQPIVPRLAANVLDQLNIPVSKRKWHHLQPFLWESPCCNDDIPLKKTIGNRRPLFQRIQN